jgi:hypothetical protein
MTDIATDVAVLKKDIERMNDVFGRLDTAIEKISELSSNISNLLSVHEERLNSQTKTNEELYSTIEKNQEKIELELKELTKTLSDTKTEVALAMKSIDNKIAEHVDKKTNTLTHRIYKLEKWRWIVVGGGIVVIGLLSAIAKPLIDHFLGK